MEATNHPAPVIRDDAALVEIEARITKLPEGPWFAAFDRAKECGPHRDSGLALVDTGREGDWPIARLCEWHAAKFIAASITDIPALCQTVRAAWARIADLTAQWCQCGHIKDKHGFFSDHDECYECDQASPDLCCEWRPAPRTPDDTYAALREQLAATRIELQVVNGDACKEEQDAGSGPCGICRTCLQSRLAQVEKERPQTRQRPVGWISCGLRRGHDRAVDMIFENAECAKAFIDGIEPAVGPIVAATQMRDKCVAKVKTMKAEYDSKWQEVAHPEKGGAITSQSWQHYSNAANEIITALESLTLDVEQKEAK